MTARILGHRSADPSICGCCARRANDYLAFWTRQRNDNPMWICTRCAPTGQEVFTMPAKDLDIYESRALHEAHKKVADTQVNAVLQALWDEGITDLSALDEEKLGNVMDRLHLDGTMNQAAKDTLLHYEASIRKQIKNGDAPF